MRLPAGCAPLDAQGSVVVCVIVREDGTTATMRVQLGSNDEWVVLPGSRPRAMEDMRTEMEAGLARPAPQKTGKLRLAVVHAVS